jgi:ABC-2 type transport system ATP-binding protein
VSPLIEAAGLRKCYAGAPHPAVESLTLSIMGGEIFGFLGENGAGKTTTIKMLCGLIPPSSGVAHIAGFDVEREAQAAKRALGYVPDNPFLYEKLTGTEFLELMGDLYDVPRDSGRTTDLLRLFDLEEKKDTLIGGYSRGMRQKIALAAQLLHRPKALFLDEPTVGLDPKGVLRLHDVLKAVAAQGAAVFLSTHVLEAARELCDRIGILHQGRLVAIGTPAELTAGGRRLEDVFLEATGGHAREADELARLLAGSR